MTKQRILFITTGGTIASVHTPQGLRPVLSSDELLAHLPELNDLCIPETLALRKPIEKAEGTEADKRKEETGV